MKNNRCVGHASTSVTDQKGGSKEGTGGPSNGRCSTYDIIYFRNRNITTMTVVMLFNWPIVTLGYFGLGLSMADLGDNVFVR